jgi:hypothetical protein
VTSLGVQPNWAFWTRSDHRPDGRAIRYLPLVSVVTRLAVVPVRENTSVAWLYGAEHGIETWQTGFVGPRVTTP